MVKRVWIERLTDIFSWLLPTLTAIGMGYGWLRTFRNREAEAARIEAETDTMASTEWRKLYDEIKAENAAIKSGMKIIQSDNREMSRKIDTLQNELGATKMDLEVANMEIEFFKEYLIEQGLDIPELKFRGDDKE